MGERRLTFHRPCGISVLPKLDVDGIVGGTGACGAASHIVAKAVELSKHELRLTGLAHPC